MKIKELIKKLQNIKESLQDKEVKIYSSNGMLFDPEIKFQLKDRYNAFDKSKENVECIVLSP